MDIEKLKQKNLELTKKKVKESVSDDQLIINTINTIEELDKTLNSLSMRLRDWFSLINPETEHQLQDNEILLKVIVEDELQKSEMGAVLKKQDKEQIIKLAANLKNLFEYKNSLEVYLEEVQERHIPNIQDITGTLIAAKLLREAKSLRKLATLQSGTIQLFGAEKALFRHIKTGARPPKYGFLLNHIIVQNSKEKGKTARALADKISICARLDYFKGERLGTKYFEELKEKWKK
jgi:nucleolar protein 56